MKRRRGGEETAMEALTSSSRGVRSERFEVFLSFRGLDSRLTIADPLYNAMDREGIHAFKDNKELLFGKMIGGGLSRAIDKSKIYIPIFSKGYASSKSCLQELAQMVECKRRSTDDDQKVILPIFYDVDADDVELKTDLYRQALQNHKSDSGEHLVRQWEEALKEVGRIMGKDTIDYGLTKLTNLMVKEVSNLLWTRPIDVSDHLVGIKAHMDEIMELLDLGAFDVRSIVIHGTSGIGKTTLAEAVYKQISSQFQDHCCFLKDVRTQDIINLQKKLLFDFLKMSCIDLSDIEVNDMIKTRFRGKKVLIVLDDIDNQNQISSLAMEPDWFGGGSRIIITTRNIEFLVNEGEDNNVPASNSRQFSFYEMPKMEPHDALQLFCERALGCAKPPFDFIDITHKLINALGRLPLALDVVGSTLRGKCRRTWEGTLGKLKKVMNEDVKKKLMISYKALGYIQQQIYLDIACFFINNEKANAVKYWDALFDRQTEIEVNALKRMSLIKISNDDTILMHDQLRDLGRDIVCLESREIHLRGSRLWSPKDAFHVVQSKMGSENVVALNLGIPESDVTYNFKRKEFARMVNLRFLQLDRGNFKGDFKNLFTKLRWLSWSNCPYEFQATNFGLENLVVLKLSKSDITEDWGGWCQIMVSKQLKVLQLEDCPYLTKAPEFSTISQLERLIIRCTQLREIDESIGNLQHLDYLEIHCEAIESLPESIGNLKSLMELRVESRRLSMLPYSIGNLVKLKHLILTCQELQELPDSVGQLESLLEMDVYDTRIRELPYSIGNLQRLKILKIPHLELEELPDSIGRLQSLVKLDMEGSKVRILPDCIGNLKKLKSMEELEDESGQPPVDVETSDSNYTITSVQTVVGIDDRAKQITDPMEMEVDDESTEKMKDETGQRPEDMETSDRNYAIAAVQNIVGIDGCIKQITDLLEMEVNDEARILGIYGTDGIGKTTLAKAVYDRISCCFDSRSFLAEVDETAQDRRGVQILQTRLVRDILEQDREDPSFDERIEDFLDIFRERKVLLVVDGVEGKSHLRAIVGDQLHRFGPGSRIIVTSRNEEILKDYDAEKARTYLVCPLEDRQAFELFCMHAFRMQSSIPDYDGLANRIVKAAEKLPLAVEVVGSFLRGKSIQEWAKMEKSMKERTRSSRKTTVGPEEILDICCKELDQQQKDIFLDIACFISGVDARIASYMWPNCCLPSSGCILMPLAKTGENNELLMHRLLRCLGKRICKQEESQDPRSRRFCTQDMVLEAMNREKGMGNVEALCLDFTAGDLQSMPKIRFLKLDNARVSGNFAGAFASLRWLCWQRCPPEFDAENLVLRELAILELPRGKITEDWGGWRKIKMPKLKVLNLTGCSDLLFTPKFSGYKDLEILILEGCSRLVKLDPSIGHLKRLVSLNLKFCSRLNWLPVEMGGMTALKELFIDGTCVREMPISIGNLNQLKTLTGFECFSLTKLPSSISYLTALSDLSLDGAKITELPTSLGELLNLRHLSLRDCRYLEELPHSIGKMGSSLEELDISATNISELPSSIGNLESLKVLRMDSSFIRAFPGEIGNLTNLEELHASWCRSLKGVPSDIEGLRNLRSLTLGHSRISSLPPEISSIPGLHTLDLVQCNEIKGLPKLPPSLIHLRVSSKRMEMIPLLEGLKELEELCLSDGDPKAHRPPSSKRPMPESNVIDEQSFLISFPKLRKLELSLSQVIKLQFGLKDDIPLPKRLKTLTHAGSSCKEVLELTKMLSVFKLYDSAIEKIEGLEGLEALMRLEISNCRIRNLKGISQLTSLRSLILSDCDCLSSLDLSNMKLLKVLEIRRCKMIHQIKGLEKLTPLVKPYISECPALVLDEIINQ